MALSQPVLDLLAALRRTQEECYNIYRVELTFKNEVLGGIPLRDDMLQGILEHRHTSARFIKADLARARKRIDEVAEAEGPEAALSEVEAKAKEEAEKNSASFWFDKHGPFLVAYNFKRNLLETGVSFGLWQAKRGSKQTLHGLMEPYGCHWDWTLDDDTAERERLHFYRAGVLLPDVDYWLERTIHPTTPQGPISSVVRQAAMCPDETTGEHVKIRLLLYVGARLYAARASAALRDQDVLDLLARSCTHALGATRALGYGQFDITYLARVTDHPVVLPAKGEPAPE